MIYIGLIFLCLGIVCLFLIYKKMALLQNTAMIISVYFIILGLALILADMYLLDKDKMKVMGIGIGLIFIWYAIHSLYCMIKCCVKITGTYIGSQAYTSSKGIVRYAPIFEYTYLGYHYQTQSFQSFSAYYIDKHFTPYENYFIYIDPNHYRRILVKHKLQMFDIFMFIFGLLFIICPFMIS
ncbi:hypothetical protein [Candidatus Stoquefichus massiliensis]|uniref:hypothetical protein n=1 Tax=Candidatus Stoquefichus massiliensis TaxID=1470350 RepID=UPI0004870CA9|nr:hypothetical protein [Candidatus Stoquefichus massiliensis]